MPSSPSAQRIKEAYLGLLAEQPDAPITVTEIARRAHVNRVTFYRLYETREDVLLDILDEFDRGTKQQLDSPSVPRTTDSMVVHALEHHRKNARMLKAVLDSSAAVVLERRIEEGIREPVMMSLGWDGERELSPVAKMFLSFYAAGISRVICDWIRGGCVEDPRTLQEFLANVSTRYEMVPSEVFASV